MLAFTQPAAGVAFAAHHVVVAVGHDDHATGVGPVAHPVVHGDPAGAGGDDVEQRQAICARDQCVGQRQRGRLELEWVAQLRAEEQGALQSDLLERPRDGVAHYRNSGVAASNAGVVVMGFASSFSDDRTRP
jgi:hypothetical protein